MTCLELNGIKMIAPSRCCLLLVSATATTMVLASRSAKVEENRTTQIIVRDAKFGFNRLFFKQFARVSAVKLLREGTPCALVDTRMCHKISIMIEEFVERSEERNQACMWLDIRPLIQPVSKKNSSSTTLQQPQRKSTWKKKS